MGFALQVVSHLPCLSMPLSHLCTPKEARRLHSKAGEHDGPSCHILSQRGHSLSNKPHVSAVILGKQGGGCHISQLPGEKGSFELGAWRERAVLVKSSLAVTCHPEHEAPPGARVAQRHSSVDKHHLGSREYGRLSGPRRPPPGRAPSPLRTVYEAQAGSQAFWGH